MTTSAVASVREHALLSASGASRWLACPPSARLEDTFPETTSAFAEEGTLAHEMAAVELQKYLFHIPAVEYTAAWTRFRMDKRVTPDFKAAVNTYVDSAIEAIRSARAINRDAVILVEQRLDYSHLVPEGFGTGDLVTLCDGVAEVRDLKFGRGVVISPENNTQLMLYGLGALNEFGMLYDIHTVRLTIHQPRLQEASQSWDLSVQELLSWAETIPPIAAQAWAGEGEFTPGDHCRWCRAKGQCRARAEAHLKLAEKEFSPPPLLSDEEIAVVLGQVDGLVKWAADIKSYALKTACAGKKFSGWKLVRGRSNRRYKDQTGAARVLLDAGFQEAAIYQPPAERQLIPLTEMEKLITRKTFTDLLSPFVEKPLGAITLVAESDRRPEVEANGVDGFEDTQEEMEA